MGMAKLRIDCQRMEASAVSELCEQLEPIHPMQVAGGDLIFIEGRIGTKEYADIWRVLDRYDVDID